MKFKKVLTLFITILLVASLTAGCGGSSTKKESSEILIGLNLELSGNVASYGQSQANAYELAFEEINKAGGILGKQIKLVKIDNKSDSGEALNVATRLATQDKVVAILGPVASSNVIATTAVAEQHKIPIITSTGTNPKVTVDDKTGKVRDFVFRTCFIDPFQGVVGAKFALENLNAKTAAIYVDNNSDYSKGLQKEFKKAFEAGGGTIVAEEGFVIEDKDFRATLTKLKATNPDVIYIPAYYEQVGLIAKQANEIGYTGSLLGADGWDSPKLLEIAGAEALQNGYFTNHYSTADTDPKVVKFIGDYKAKYGSVPDALAALGYDGAYILADAIKRAGAADPAKIKEAFATTKGFEGVTGKVSIDDQHNPVKAAVILGFDKDGNQTFKAKVNP